MRRTALPLAAWVFSISIPLVWLIPSMAQEEKKAEKGEKAEKAGEKAEKAKAEKIKGDVGLLDTEFQDVLTEIDRESTVANLLTTAGFSVFVSNNVAHRRNSHANTCSNRRLADSQNSSRRISMPGPSTNEIS